MGAKVSNTPEGEFCVQLENVSFHMLIVFPDWSGFERPMRETPMHHHVFHELFVCEHGEIVIKTPDGDVLLKSGDFVIIPPAKAHVLQYVEPGSSGYNVSFLCQKNGSESNVDLHKRLLSVINRETQLHRDCPEFVMRVGEVIENALCGNTDKLLTALHMLELLMSLINEKEGDLSKTEELLKDETISDDIERMMELDKLIATRYRQKCSCEYFAKKLFVSTRQLDRIAIKHYGKSIHKLIVDRRFYFAEQLLLTTELTVEEVAASAGFSSSASLYREFRNRLNTTPAEFRVQASEKN